MSFKQPTRVSTALRYINYRRPCLYKCKQTERYADRLLDLLHLEDEGTTIYRNIGKYQRNDG